MGWEEGGVFQVFLIFFNHGNMGHFKESLLRIYTFGRLGQLVAPLIRYH